MSRGGFGRGGVRLAGVSAGYRRRKARPTEPLLLENMLGYAEEVEDEKKAEETHPRKTWAPSKARHLETPIARPAGGAWHAVAEENGRTILAACGESFEWSAVTRDLGAGGERCECAPKKDEDR